MLKKLKGVLIAVSATGAALIGQAHAAVPSSVTTALTDAATDSVTVAGLALAIIVGIAAFKYMRRAI